MSHGYWEESAMSYKHFIAKWDLSDQIMEIFCKENNFDDPVHLCNLANYDELLLYLKPRHNPQFC